MSSTEVVRSSAEAEASVLGSVVLCPDLLVEIQGILEPEDFYSDRHRTIYRAVLGLVEQRRAVDTLTLFDALQAEGKLEQAGGADYLASVVENCTSPLHGAHHARMVRDYAIKRRAELALTEAVEQVRACPGGEAVEHVRQAQASLYGLVDGRSDNQPEPAQEGLRVLFQDLDARSRNGGGLAGMPTGFTDLDRKLSGLQRKQMVIVAARPSMGKSSLAKGIALGLVQAGHGVVVFPLEDGRNRFLLRSLSELSGVGAAKLRDAQLGNDEFDLLWVASEDLSRKAPDGAPLLYVDDPSTLTPAAVRSRVMNLKRKAPIGVVIVDYLQLMHSSHHYKDSREREVAETSKELKAMAKELDVCMVVVAQLSRASEKRTNKRPMLSDLRESGSIEQDADAVLLIYRDDYYNQQSKDPGVAEIIIAKGRDAEVGTVRLTWDPACVRFRNLAPRYQYA